MLLFQEEKFAHLDQAEVEKVSKCVDEKSAWWTGKMTAQDKIKPYDNPVILASQVYAEIKVTHTFMSVLNM